MKCKVLLDTCVLIAASTYYVSRDWSTKPIKHPFYEQSISLIEFLKKNVEKRIGIVTRTIEAQAPKVLGDAIKEEITRRKIDRQVDFEIYSAIQNSCETRLKDILACLLREPVDEDTVNNNYVIVDKIYEELSAKAVEKITEYRAKKWTEAAAKRFRQVALPIYQQRQQMEDAQLVNLIKKPVEYSDKKILAEAVYLSMLYNRVEMEPVTFCIASTDHHFSPYRWKGGIESSQVTDRIKEKFGIICDWPQQIEELSKQTLERGPYGVPEAY